MNEAGRIFLCTGRPAVFPFFPFTALTTFLYTSARSLFFCTFGCSKYSKSL